MSEQPGQSAVHLLRAASEGWRDGWHGLCARRAPTIKRWSLDARNGDHTSHLAECRGRVELSLISTCAVEDQSAPIPEEITSALGRIIFISRSFGLGCANSRGPLVFTSSLRLGWKGCGLRRSTWLVPRSSCRCKKSSFYPPPRLAVPLLATYVAIRAPLCRTTAAR